MAKAIIRFMIHQQAAECFASRDKKFCYQNFLSQLVLRTSTLYPSLSAKDFSIKIFSKFLWARKRCFRLTIVLAGKHRILAKKGDTPFWISPQGYLYGL